MKLEQIIPQEASFSLRSTGEEYTLRPFSLSDTAWLNSRYKDKEFEKVMEDMNMTEIVKIVYHQLKLEDKKKFLAMEVEEVSDEGELITKKYTGPERLMQEVHGLEEEFNIY